MTTTKKSSLLPVLFIVGFGGVCFAVGRYSVPPSAPAVVTKSECPSKPTLASVWRPPAPSPKPQPKVPNRPIIEPPLELASVEDPSGEEELRRYEQKQSEDLVKLLKTRLKRVAVAAGRDDVPEALVTQMTEYMAGWVDALIRTSPALADDLAHEVETTLCDPQASDSEIMLFARLGQHMPELTSLDGFECVISQRSGEDMVLWETLDSLRASGLPAPRSLADLEARAEDERTVRRLQAFRQGVPDGLKAPADGTGSVTEYQVPVRGEPPARELAN